MVDDLPLESWEVKVNHGIEAEAGNKIKRDVATSKASGKGSHVLLPSGGDARSDLDIINRVVHPSVSEEIRLALRLSIDRSVRVLLAVSLLSGQTREIHYIENNVTTMVDRFHYEITRHCESEEEKEKVEEEACTRLRVDIRKCLKILAFSRTAERAMKIIEEIGKMPKFLKPKSKDLHDEDEALRLFEISNNEEGLPTLTKGYLSDTVQNWWLWTAGLCKIRSSIIRQVSLFVGRECGIDLNMKTDDRRASAIVIADNTTRRRA